MPYIYRPSRARLALEVKQLPETAGELNYCITQLCQRYLEREGDSYTVRNEIIGALECAKLEFYRRAVVPFECRKILENGDIY
jgi:hypothetical protein